jgi:hypothetical protein
MKAHESKFDHTLGMLWERRMQLNAFIRQGQAGAGKGALSSEQQARFDRAIHKQLRQASSELA